ncbi:MAG: DMT family transporter, partial [Opitutae bacterium]|nr:DMT family transporter [Opitutae bacterium]
LYTTAGKAGFITGLYLVIVPLIGFCLRQKIDKLTIAGALIATYGLYLLSITEGFNIGQGDTLVLIGAFFWAVHVQVVGYAAKYKLDALKLAILQYLICAGLNLVLALFLEEFSMQATLDASGAILYAGLISVGVAYTLQIVAQKHIDPSRAAIILSLEAVFAVLGAWLAIILGLSFAKADEILNSRQAWGCILMFAGMMLSQLPGLGKKTESERSIN